MEKKPIQKENSGSFLTAEEKECIKEILTQESYKDLSITEIKNKLVNDLLDQERDSIYKIADMETNLEEVRNKLDDLDNQFKDLEATIESHTSQYLSIINELSTCESQNKIVDIRLRNQQILKESIII